MVTSPPYHDMRLSFNSNLWSFPDVAKQLYRIIKEGSLVCWAYLMKLLTVQDPNIISPSDLFQRIRVSHYDTLFYVKANPSYPASFGRYNLLSILFSYFLKGRPSCVSIGICDVEVKGAAVGEQLLGGKRMDHWIQKK